MDPKEVFKFVFGVFVILCIIAMMVGAVVGLNYVIFTPKVDKPLQDTKASVAAFVEAAKAAKEEAEAEAAAGTGEY